MLAAAAIALGAGACDRTSPGTGDAGPSDAVLHDGPPGNPGTGVIGFVGNRAALDLQTHEVYTVDLGLRDYPIFTTAGATHTFEPHGGWNGGPSARMTPPLSEGYAAIGAFDDLWRGASFTIRKLNFRFEIQLGPEFGTHWPEDDLKFVIVHTADTLGGDTNERPMCNWANASTIGSGILAWAVGASTTKNFNRTPPFPAALSPSGNEDFYVGPTAGNFNGKPTLGPAEWISIEVEVIAESTPEAPAGRIRSVLTRRNGTTLTDLSIPWTYDVMWSLPRFIHEVQVIGGFYNTGTTAADPDNYYRIADYITFAANRPGLLGPRPGFVQ